MRVLTLIGSILLTARSFCAACTFRSKLCFLLWKAYSPGLERLLSTGGKLWRVVAGQKLNKEMSHVLLGEELSMNYVGKYLNVTRPQLLMWNWGRVII